MSARAICDVCKTEVEIRTTPLGVALMPKEWLCTVRRSATDDLNVIDVCGETCATNYDKLVGLPKTEIETEAGTTTLEHSEN